MLLNRFCWIQSRSVQRKGEDVQFPHSLTPADPVCISAFMPAFKFTKTSVDPKARFFRATAGIKHETFSQTSHFTENSSDPVPTYSVDNPQGSDLRNHLFRESGQQKVSQIKTKHEEHQHEEHDPSTSCLLLNSSGLLTTDSTVISHDASLTNIEEHMGDILL
ncbi:hypothetical protein ILYODFUR_027393 [Ilyodon furcidens]|uniref:Uncharacterized protein n=1 Tax=Ilyodon furcidens TaxID=33524 RepID=A0ABV0TR99_9TELE